MIYSNVYVSELHAAKYVSVICSTICFRIFSRNDFTLFTDFCNLSFLILKTWKILDTSNVMAPLVLILILKILAAVLPSYCSILKCHFV